MIELTEKQQHVKTMLADKMLDELPKMTLDEIKENYIYMCEDPIFSIKYRIYNKEQLDSFTDETKEDLVSYFKLGLNMYKTNVANAKYLDVL